MRDRETNMTVEEADRVLEAEPGEYSREAILDAKVTINRQILANRGE